MNKNNECKSARERRKMYRTAIKDERRVNSRYAHGQMWAWILTFIGILIAFASMYILTYVMLEHALVFESFDALFNLLLIVGLIMLMAFSAWYTFWKNQPLTSALMFFCAGVLSFPMVIGFTNIDSLRLIVTFLLLTIAACILFIPIIKSHYIRSMEIEYEIFPERRKLLRQRP